MIDSANTYKNTAIVLVLAAVFSYLYIDKPLAIGINQLGMNKSGFWKGMTEFGDSFYYLVTSLGIWFFFRKRSPKLARMAIYVFWVVALSGIFVDIIKVIFARYRPAYLFKHDWYGFHFFHIKTNYLSFPSGHSATVFSAAAMLGYFFKKFRLPLAILAVFTAFSRVAITKHYLSDVFIGSLVGISFSMFFYYYLYLEYDEKGNVQIQD